MVRNGDGVVAGIGLLMPELSGHRRLVGRGRALDVMQAGRMVAIQDPTAPGSTSGRRATTSARRSSTSRAPAWNELVTPDLDTATTFYSTVLGVGWETMQMNGGDYTCLVAGGRPVGAAPRGRGTMGRPRRRPARGGQ